MIHKTEEEKIAARKKALEKYRNSPKGIASAQRAWQNYYPRYRDKALASHRRVKYGITQDEYQQLIQEQDGKCAICEQEMKPPQIDHCHSTGKVRGLLCGSCNKALGLMRDNCWRLAKAIIYLNPCSLPNRR